MNRTLAHLARCSMISLPFISCASTNIRSQVDPQTTARGYKRIMVFVNVRDLGLRQDAEQEFERRLAGKAATIVPSHKLFFPGRTYTKTEGDRILAQAGIEAVLLIRPTDAGTSSTYIPRTTTTEATATASGNTVRGTATTREHGGYEIEKPWAQYEAVLHDPASDQVVWIARMSSAGNAFAGWDHLIRSMARKTADQLVKDRVLR